MFKHIVLSIFIHIRFVRCDTNTKLVNSAPSSICFRIMSANWPYCGGNAAGPPADPPPLSGTPPNRGQTPSDAPPQTPARAKPPQTSPTPPNQNDSPRNQPTKHQKQQTPRTPQTHAPFCTPENTSRQHGLDADLPPPEHQPAGKGAKTVARPAARADDQPAEPGLVCRHHLSPDAAGSFYLVAIMDWHSRRALSWRLSNTLEAEFCADA